MINNVLENPVNASHNISSDDRNALKDLKDDATTIIIIPADKGKATVDVDKSDLLGKLNDLINSGKYTKVNKNPKKFIKKITV